jgi:hypothetical protein
MKCECVYMCTHVECVYVCTHVECVYVCTHVEWDRRQAPVIMVTHFVFT